MKKIAILLLIMITLMCSVNVNAEKNDFELQSVTHDFELKSLGYVYSRDFLTNDEMYSVHVKAINNTSSKVKCNVFAAIYDATGHLKVVEVQEQVIFHDSSNTVTFNIPSNFNDGGRGRTVKVFMWEAEMVKPLTEVLDVTAETSD